MSSTSPIWWCIRSPWTQCVAIDEFGAGTLDGNPADGPSFDACGAAVIENVAANLEFRLPNYSNIGHIRADMITNGQWSQPATVSNPRTNGCFIENVAWEIPRRNYAVAAFQLYNPALISAGVIEFLLAKYQSCGHIYIIANAQALQGNEHGVQGHFVAIAGYDEAAHSVYVINSDIAGQHGTATGQWMAVSDFMLAQPGGYAIMARPAPPPPPPPPPATVTVDKSALTSAMAALDTASAALHKLLGV